MESPGPNQKYHLRLNAVFLITPCFRPRRKTIEVIVHSARADIPLLGILNAVRQASPRFYVSRDGIIMEQNNHRLTLGLYHCQAASPRDRLTFLCIFLASREIGHHLGKISSFEMMSPCQSDCLRITALHHPRPDRRAYR